MARRTREEWKREVARWQRSGLTRGEYAERAGINAHTLGWWKWKLGSEAEPTAAPTFVELVPAVIEVDAEEVDDLELLVSDVRVRVPPRFDADALSRVLDVLEARR